LAAKSEPAEIAAELAKTSLPDRYAEKLRGVTFLQVLYLLGIAAGVAAIAWAVAFERLPALQGGYLMLCAVLTGASFFKFLQSLDQENFMFIESHWGGLGGGLGGWRVSRSLTYFVTTAGLAVLLWSGITGVRAAGDDQREERLDGLVERYYPAIQVARQNGILLQVRLSGTRLLLAGWTPGRDATDKFWDAIKQASPAWAVETDVELRSPVSNENDASGSAKGPEAPRK